MDDTTVHTAHTNTTHIAHTDTTHIAHTNTTHFAHTDTTRKKKKLYWKIGSLADRIGY